MVEKDDKLKLYTKVTHYDPALEFGFSLSWFLGCSLLMCLICIGIKAKRKMVIQRHLDQGEREPQIQLGDFMHSERITQTKRLEVINRVKDSLIRSQFMEIKKCMERNQETCPICLEEYQEQDKVAVTSKCNHLFHAKCIDLWLDTGKLRCPVCNFVFEKEEMEVNRVEARNVWAGNLDSEDEDEDY